MTLAADREMAKPKRIKPTAEAVAAESRSPPTRRGESSRDAQGFRAAYEALIEPLVNVTIKLAAAETEQQAQQAQITALKGELHGIEKRLAETNAALAL